MVDIAFNPMTGEIDLVSDDSCSVTFKNTVQITKTTIGTTATKIDLPTDGQYFKLRYSSVETLWIGADNTIAEDGAESFPVISDEYFGINLAKGNGNDLYGISPSGNIDVYIYTEIEV